MPIRDSHLFYCYLLFIRIWVTSVHVIFQDDFLSRRLPRL